MCAWIDVPGEFGSKAHPATVALPPVTATTSRLPIVGAGGGGGPGESDGDPVSPRILAQAQGPQPRCCQRRRARASWVSGLAWFGYPDPPTLPQVPKSN